MATASHKKHEEKLMNKRVLVVIINIMQIDIYGLKMSCNERCLFL